MAERSVKWHRELLAGNEASEQQRSELAAAFYVSEQWEEAGALIEN